MRRVPLLVVLLAVLAGVLPAAALAQEQQRPALVPAGVTDDGWEVLEATAGLLPPALPPGVPLRAEVHFVLGGLPRAVRVLVPPGVARPAPVLVSLHGLHEAVDQADRVQQWGPLARSGGFVLVQGVGHEASWNAGTCCGGARDAGVDDVRYLDEVLALVRALVPVDPRRVYATGFSNGAMMAYRWACERRTTVAGVLAVAGTVTASCAGRADVAVLHVHGQQDRTVPLAGLAHSRLLGSPLPPVSRTSTWFGPRITAKVLPRFGHGWPTASRGGYATSRSGWAWLAARPKP